MAHVSLPGARCCLQRATRNLSQIRRVRWKWPPWWCWSRRGTRRGGAQEDARDGKKLEEILQDMQAAEAAPICQHLVRELFTRPRQAAAAAS